MSTYEFTLSLDIRHPAIDPQVITQTLAIEPQHTWRAGDPRSGDSGEQLGGVYRESYWTAKLMQDPELASDGNSVESSVMKAVALLQRSQSFLEQLNTDGGVAELHISLFTRGDFRLDLDADSLAMIDRLRLAIGLDVHLHKDDTASTAPAN